MTPRAIVVGTVSMDLVAGARAATTARAAVGNSGANIAVRLATLGWEVEIISLVGPDPAGEMIAADLKRWGVGTSGLVVRDEYLSPRVFQVEDGADRGSASLLATCPRCDRPRGHLLELPHRDELPQAVRARARTADLVLSDVAGDLSVELASAATGTVWFEASLREASTPAMRALAARSHVVKVSAEDAEYYAPALEVTGARTIAHVVTEGASGVRWRTRHGDWSRWHHEPSHLHATPVDTIGAGDAFTATAADALVSGAQLGAAMAAGSDAAARACLAGGARGDMLLPDPGASSWLRQDVAFQCGRCDVSTTRAAR